MSKHLNRHEQKAASIKVRKGNHPLVRRTKVHNSKKQPRPFNPHTAIKYYEEDE